MNLVRKSRLFLIVFMTLLFQLNNVTALGHSGRTDSNGGHKDNKNVSGLGSYHYHHGESAHLHPNGICPYSSTSSSISSEPIIDTEVQEKAAENQGYSAGYEDGKSGDLKNPSQYSTGDRDSFRNGYNTGYDKGREEFLAEQEIVKLQADEIGYEDGYANSTNNSTSYTGVHQESYKESYQLAYNRGEAKRKKEIKKIKTQAITLGELHGYNRENYSIDYDGTYKTEYQKAYKKGLAQGQKKLEDELNEVALESYKFGVLGMEVNFERYENKFLIEEATSKYTEGYKIYEEVIVNRPILGQSLKLDNEYATDKNHIQIGLSKISDKTLIAISDQSRGKVENIEILIDKIVPDGLDYEETLILLKNILSEEVVDAYEQESAQTRVEEGYSYRISKMKRIKKVEKSLSRNFYLITKIKEDKVLSIEINNKIPSDIKKLELL